MSEASPAPCRPCGEFDGEHLDQLRISCEVLDLLTRDSRRLLGVRPRLIAANARSDTARPSFASTCSNAAQLCEATIEAQPAQPIARTAAHAAIVARTSDSGNTERSVYSPTSVKRSGRTGTKSRKKPAASRELNDGEIAEAWTERIHDALNFRFDPSLGKALYAGIGPSKPTTVVVEVDADHAREAASYKWNDTQKVHTLRNGSVRVSFTCDDYAPVVAWILRFGSHAMVMKPPALATAVGDQIRATASLYARARKRR